MTGWSPCFRFHLLPQYPEWWLEGLVRQNAPSFIHVVWSHNLEFFLIQQRFMVLFLVGYLNHTLKLQYAFLEFDTQESAAQFMSTYNNSTLPGVQGVVKLDYAVQNSRERRGTLSHGPFLHSNPFEWCVTDSRAPYMYMNICLIEL